MKKFLSSFMVTFLILMFGGLSQASVIDFTANAYRGGNATGTLPTITENSSENGFDVVTTEAGQKASYGTDYFNGWALSDIDSLQFTFKNTSSTAPYSNLIITNGSSYGVISSQGGYRTGIDSTNGYQATITYYFAGKNGNADNNYNFGFYEPSGSTSWSHGAKVTWNDIKDWTLLGIGDIRPFSSGEGSVARAPISTALNIIWGDSQANYIGEKAVWDVSVTTISGKIYQAGPIPEPATMLLFGLGLLGVAGIGRRKK